MTSCGILYTGGNMAHKKPVLRPKDSILLISLKNDRHQGPLHLSEMLPKTLFFRKAIELKLPVILEYKSLSLKKTVVIKTTLGVPPGSVDDIAFKENIEVKVYAQCSKNEDGRHVLPSK